MVDGFGEAVDRGLLLMAASGRMRRVGAVAAGAVVAGSAARAGWSAYDTRRRWKLSVISGEVLYDKASDWLERVLADSAGVHLRLHTDPQDRTVLRGGVVFDRPQTVMVGGHPIRVTSELHEAPTARNFTDDLMQQPTSLIFSGVGSASRAAMLAQLRELATQQSDPGMYIAHKYGAWTRRGLLVPRELDTVIIEGRDELVADLERFLAARAEYERLGLPWHRGYLLHGPAGTGKTSLAMALAHHFDRDIYYLPLSDLDRDTSLLDVVAEVSTRCILLIEDVDIVHAAKSRDDSETRGVSLAGLLNALDGVATPQGMVTVMTTNSAHVLDPALLRAGRVDLSLEVGYLTDGTLDAMLRRFCGEGLPTGRHVLPDVPPADVMEVIKSGLGTDVAHAQVVERFTA